MFIVLIMCIMSSYFVCLVAKIDHMVVPASQLSGFYMLLCHYMSFLVTIYTTTVLLAVSHNGPLSPCRSINETPGGRMTRPSWIQRTYTRFSIINQTCLNIDMSLNKAVTGIITILISIGL